MFTYLPTLWFDFQDAEMPPLGPLEFRHVIFCGFHESRRSAQGWSAQGTHPAAPRQAGKQA